MSTEVRSRHGGVWVTLNDTGAQYAADHATDPKPPHLISALVRAGVDVLVTLNGERTGANVPVPEFLAAVQSELNVRLVPADAIVIERSELPAVEVDDELEVFFSTGGKYGMRGGSPHAHMQHALEHLALAEHLAANPSVDEAQVDALARALADVGGTSWAHYTDQARALVVRGVRIEVAS